MTSNPKERRVSRRTILSGACEWLATTNNLSMIPHLARGIQKVVETDISRHETSLFIEGIEGLEAALYELLNVVELNPEGEETDHCIDALELALEKVDEWARRFQVVEEEG
jgi:hypothetical protein